MSNRASKRHHYLPRFYLRGFADPSKPSHIWVYEKSVSRYSISVCCRRAASRLNTSRAALRKWWCSISASVGRAASPTSRLWQRGQSLSQGAYEQPHAAQILPSGRPSAVDRRGPETAARVDTGLVRFFFDPPGWCRRHDRLLPTPRGASPPADVGRAPSVPARLAGVRPSPSARCRQGPCPTGDTFRPRC